MATFLGNSGTVNIGGNAVAEVLDWSITESVSPPDDTVIGDTYKTHKNGSTAEWSGAISCYWDDTDTTGQVAMTVDASVSLTLHPEGDTAGDYEYSGTATITSIEASGALDGVMTANFSFQGNGALTRGTVGA
jgi:hypothetical protein